MASRLLAHSRAASFEITALVRSEEQAGKLRSLGLKTAIGSYQNTDQLENLAAEADVLFSTVLSASLDSYTLLTSSFY